MRKTIGPVVIIDTNPPAEPYRRWDGNQATYLFFPLFVSFLLVLLSGLSEPIIGGLSVVNVNSGPNGTLSLGTWGWCVKGVPGVKDFCSGERGFGNEFNFTSDSGLEDLPEPLHSFKDITEVISRSYLIANGIFHVFAALFIWMSLTWALAASGNWHNKVENAWEWTRWSYHGTGISALFIMISWGLDLGLVTRVQGKAVNVDGTQPPVLPGPAVWMMMTAFLLTLITYLIRLIYLRRLPRPLWTVKGAGGDFHNPHPPPLSAALAHPDEQPPTWESLDINAPVVLDDEKEALEEERKYYEEVLAESQRAQNSQDQLKRERGSAV